MSRKLFLFLAFWLILSACSAPSSRAEQGIGPAQAPAPGAEQSPGGLPLSEADVPRVSVEAARAASESGAAIIVDVRSEAAYEVSHVAGAINIPLSEIESNPTGLSLDKDRWIITYCT